MLIIDENWKTRQSMMENSIKQILPVLLFLFLIPGKGTSLLFSQYNQGTPLSIPVYNVRDFGAVGDKKTLDTRAFQDAIKTAEEAGGGTVFVPPGDYYLGTIELQDNITFYLENGCTLWGSTNLDDYQQNKHLIFARNAKNIVICGQGAIHGNGPAFWDNGRLEKWYRGEIDLPRTSDMLRFDSCSNVVLEDIDVLYGAFWNIGFGHCNRITIRAITMRNGVYENDGPNTDGINLWNCQKVQISDCDIITGDDCLVVLGDSKDITINNCKLQTSETALMISGVRNLTFSNSTIHDSGCGIGFRTWSGIVVDGVAINNIVISTTDKFKGGGTAIYMWSFPLYVETAIPDTVTLPPPADVRNISISHVIARANGLLTVIGDRNGYIKGLTLDNLKLIMHGGKISEYNEAPPYPYPIYGFHNASPYGMFFRHVEDLKVRDVEVVWSSPEKADWGSALRCQDVINLEIEGFQGRQSKGSNFPSIGLRNVDGAFIHNCLAPAGTTAFIGIDEKSNNVSIMNNDLSHAQSIFIPGNNFSKIKVFESCNRVK